MSTYFLPLLRLTLYPRISYIIGARLQYKRPYKISQLKGKLRSLEEAT